MLKLIGKNADLMMQRLQSWSLKDGTGTKGDSLTLSINSTDIDGIPPKGEIYQVYLDNVKRDIFQIAQRRASLHPCEVNLVLTAAPYLVDENAKLVERQSASWDQTTLEQVIYDSLSPLGYDVWVHPQFRSVQIEHCDRTDESAAAFIRRLASQYDAVQKPVDNSKYVFLPSGQSQSASQQSIETIQLTIPAVNHPSLPNFVNVTADLDGRNAYRGVQAWYVSCVDGSRKQMQIGQKPFKLLGRDKNSQTEAQHAAEAELRRIKRLGRKLTIQAPVNPKVFSEGLVELDATFPRAFQGTCSVDEVTFTGQGLQTRQMTIQATLPLS